MNYLNPLLKKSKVIFILPFNIWGADHVDGQLISIWDKGVRFFLCVTYVYRVVPLKGKKGITITKAFHKIFHEFGYNPDKLFGLKSTSWIDQRSESMVAWLWHWNIFNVKRRKICCSWNIHQDPEEQDLEAGYCSIKKCVYY